MSGLELVEIPISGAQGTTPGMIIIALLPATNPHKTPPPLLDLRGSPDHDPGAAPVQILEGQEYRFSLELASNPEPLTIEPTELFQADTKSGQSGRLRPGLRTGTVSAKVYSLTGLIGTFEFEVRSQKLDYLRHYRWMLRDLTESMTEIIMERFAAAEQRFTIDDERDALTLYQRFALLKSLLEDGHLLGALHYILARPYSTWVDEEEAQLTAQGVRASSQMIRQLARPGARQHWHGGHPRLPTIPRQVQTLRSFPSVDNPPNQFVKFALERWRQVVAQIHRALARERQPSAPIRRGLRETEALLQLLDAWLGEELFREVGPMTQVPAGSQVLQKRAGYRAVYQTYIQFELATKLTWEADDVYGAGQRDVATLYEYWAFLQLLDVVANLCERDFDHSALFQLHENGLSLGLRQGKWKAFSGTAKAIGGRPMKVELHFNKTFRQGKGSWTRSMRPDCSLRIIPRDKPADFEDVWIHFDAKYRVDALSEIMGDDEEDDSNERAIEGQAKREDLLKMHAYRDAIRRSAGAYVLYPGSETQPIQEFHEILPGLGAFPLFPTETGAAGGEHALSGFIKEVLFHVASQVTQHERSRYWTAQTYQPHRFFGSLALPPAPFLTRPAADTLVLLGYVKDAHQLAWIRRSLSYNLRADPQRRGSVHFGSRVLATDFAILYGPPLEAPELFRLPGEPSLVRKEEMPHGGYPSAGSATYFLLPLQPIHSPAWSALLASRPITDFSAHLRSNKQPPGAPLSTNWLELSLFLTGEPVLSEHRERFLE